MASLTNAHSLTNAQKNARRIKLGICLKALISIVLLAILFTSIDLTAAFDALANPEGWPLVAACLLAPMGFIISARKWQLLVRAQSITMSVGRAIKLYFIGSFASLYLPTNVGGDAIRLYLARHHGRMEKLAASIATERVTGIAMLLVFALMGLLLGPLSMIYGTDLVFALLAISVLLPMALLAIFRPTLIAVVVQLLRIGSLGRFGRKLEDKLLGTLAAMDLYRSQRGVLVQTMGWSFLFYLSMVLSQYFHLSVVGANVGLFDVLLIAPLIPLVSLIPISINGIGLAESAFVIGYVAVGVSPELALAAALVRRLMYSVAALPGMAFWLQYKGKSETQPQFA
jgi:uncharacterized protein (TIRG00374 family)